MPSAQQTNKPQRKQRTARERYQAAGGLAIHRARCTITRKRADRLRPFIRELAGAARGDAAPGGAAEGGGGGGDQLSSCLVRSGTQ